MKKSSLCVLLSAALIACSNTSSRSSGGLPVGASAGNGVNGALPAASGGSASVAVPGTNTPSAPASNAQPGAATGGGGSAQPASASMNQPATNNPGSGGVGVTPANPAVTVDPPGTVTLKMDPFMLAPNQEIYKCQNFDNPFGGKETAVNRLVSDISPGSHHLHLYHQSEGASRTLEDCTISDFHPLMFGAAMPHTEMQYQPGMAVKVLATSGLRIQVHYLNTKNEALMVGATVKLSPVDASTITKWVSELYFSRARLSVPPGTSSITTTCSIPMTYGTIGLVASGAHMHSRGTHFVATTSTGVKLIETDDWESGSTLNDPPVMLKPGDSISWTCSYNNTTGGTLSFGESALSNEMCIYLGRFFSAPDQAQLECQAQADTGTTMLRSY